MTDENITLIVALGVAVVAFVLNWLDKRNLQKAIIETNIELSRALQAIANDKTALDKIENAYLNVPVAVRSIGTMLVNMAQTYANSTANTLDDQLVDILETVTDGEPNITENARFMPASESLIKKTTTPATGSDIDNDEPVG